VKKSKSLSDREASLILVAIDSFMLLRDDPTAAEGPDAEVELPPAPTPLSEADGELSRKFEAGREFAVPLIVLDRKKTGEVDWSPPGRAEGVEGVERVAWNCSRQPRIN
jgi:hypothetical protein